VDPREGALSGHRTGIGLEVGGIVSALLVLFIWFGVLPNLRFSGETNVGSFASNFRNFLQSNGGQIITASLGVVVALISCFLSAA